MRELSKFLREKRKEKKLSQGFLASVAGYSTPQLISNCERGRCGLPVSTLRELSEYLDYSKEDIRKLLLKEFNQKFDKEWGK